MRNIELYEKLQNLRDSTSDEQTLNILNGIWNVCYVNRDELPAEIDLSCITVFDNQVNTVFDVLSELGYFGPNRPAESYEAIFKSGHNETIQGVRKYRGSLVIRPKNCWLGMASA